MPHRPAPVRNAASRVVLLPVALLVTGCVGGWRPGFLTPPAPTPKLDSLSFVMKAGANDNWPARVALVRVQDARLVTELIRIDPSAWFGPAGEAFREAHPEAFYDDWELVPGRRAGPFGVAVDEKVAGVLFCETSAGTPPLPMERTGDVTVEVATDGCTLSAGEPASEPGK